MRLTAIGDRQREQHAQRDEPVVADDEVVPKRAECAESADHECVASSVIAASALTRRSDGGPSPEQRHQCQRVQRHRRNQDEQRRVIERPVRTRSLGTPEHPERDQHDPDGELHAVLRNAGQRRPHRDADNGHHQYGGDRGGGGQWDVVLIGAEGQGDECRLPGPRAGRPCTTT